MSLFGPKKGSGFPAFISSFNETDRLRIIRLKGNIDRTVVPQAHTFRLKIQSAPGFQRKNILFDFKNVDSIDTTVVAEIVVTLSELKNTHHKLGFINLKQRFRDEFKVLKIDALILEYATEEDAVRELSA